jgi:hypothetical protein
VPGGSGISSMVDPAFAFSISQELLLLYLSSSLLCLVLRGSSPYPRSPSDYLEMASSGWSASLAFPARTPSSLSSRFYWVSVFILPSLSHVLRVDRCQFLILQKEKETRGGSKIKKMTCSPRAVRSSSLFDSVKQCISIKRSLFPLN